MHGNTAFLTVILAAGTALSQSIPGASAPTPRGQTTGDEPRLIQISSLAPDTSAPLSALVADVRKAADAFVFLSGGASKMGEAHQRQLLSMFGALSLLAKAGQRIAVGDGGTRAGIMEAAGLARQTSGGAFPLIGVAPAAEIPPRGKTQVDPNHSHIVAVDNPAAPAHDAWGSETGTMYWLFNKLAERRPSVTIVANGGGITLAEVDANVHAGRHMILIEGSGRAADALVSLLKGTTPADAEVRSLRERAAGANLTRQSELFRIVPLQAGPTGLRDAILAALSAAK